ncbi:MAG: transporter substrate-binding domain-containing protein [Deinococcales bacterium]
MLTAMRAGRSRVPLAGLCVALAALLLMGNVRAAGWEMRVCADPTTLPFTAQDGSGFDNKIAEILAQDLGAHVTYDWHLFNSDMVNLELREGKCDMIMGVPDGYDGLLTTLPYYRSPYVFVYRADSGLKVSSLTDPLLAHLRIGLQSYGILPQDTLVHEGWQKSIVASYEGDNTIPDHLGKIITAVVNKDVQLGIAWGPVAGYFASRQPVKLDIVTVTPEIDDNGNVMSEAMTIAVRVGDTSLRDDLDRALADRWDEIQAVLKQYHVPLESVPRPVAPKGLP